jgi:F-type H+-transporting ATPase subunit epsilon
MRLKILLPTYVLVDEPATKVIAKARNGYFCLLPRHIDFLASLVPGLFSFVSEQEREEFLAVDEGILIKCGQEVLVSTRNAVRGADLGELRNTALEQFALLDERERLTRSALSRLEADFVRRFIDLRKSSHA